MKGSELIFMFSNCKGVPKGTIDVVTKDLTERLLLDGYMNKLFKDLVQYGPLINHHQYPLSGRGAVPASLR